MLVTGGAEEFADSVKQAALVVTHNANPATLAVGYPEAFFADPRLDDQFQRESGRAIAHDSDAAPPLQLAPKHAGDIRQDRPRFARQCDLDCLHVSRALV